MKYLEIKNWKKCFPKKYTRENILEIMNNSLLKNNRIDIESGCNIHIGKGKTRKSIIHRLQLEYNIVFDLDNDFNEIYILDIIKDKKIKKFSIRDAYIFIENIIKQVENINYCNLWKFVLNIK